jgi:hypothetical protein
MTIALERFQKRTPRNPALSGEVAFPAADVVEPFIDAEYIADVAGRSSDGGKGTAAGRP